MLLKTRRRDEVGERMLRVLAWVTRDAELSLSQSPRASLCGCHGALLIAGLLLCWFEQGGSCCCFSTQAAMFISSLWSWATLLKESGILRSKAQLLDAVSKATTILICASAWTFLFLWLVLQRGGGSCCSRPVSNTPLPAHSSQGEQAPFIPPQPCWNPGWSAQGST